MIILRTSGAFRRHFGTIDKLASASLDELIAVEGIGPRVAESVLRAFSTSAMLDQIKELENLEVIYDVTSKKEKASGGQVLEGKKFVITGSLPVPRDEVKDLIEAHGGQVAGSVSKKTNYLVAGDEAGSKLQKAEEFGVAVLSWDDLQKLIASSAR